MRIIGLTGSIGMGKTTTAGFFRAAGIPVHDADAAVHRLYSGPAAAAVEAAFPGTAPDGVVDRERLAEAVLGDQLALKRLEAIIHPLVRVREKAFLQAATEAGAPMAVLEIPLLFETGAEKRCDAVVVVTAEPEVQRQRVLKRPGMTEARLQALLANQMPDAEKRRRAHFLVLTDNDLDSAKRQVTAIIRALTALG
ncbi:MAG: dephospho-CoA kinase [Alphaproteobacteria bacterium]|nr:MAG: dephospho-CoA kinase [Alphaproteobacteria bacterium]